MNDVSEFTLFRHSERIVPDASAARRKLANRPWLGKHATGAHGQATYGNKAAELPHALHRCFTKLLQNARFIAMQSATPHPSYCFMVPIPPRLSRWHV
jgi:hypothetical protein